MFLQYFLAISDFWSSLFTKHLFYKHRLTLTPAWISNYIHYNVGNEITYPFPNFNGAAIEVWEWISDLISNFTSVWLPIHAGIKSYSMFVKGVPYDIP